MNKKWINIPNRFLKDKTDKLFDYRSKRRPLSKEEREVEESLKYLEEDD